MALPLTRTPAPGGAPRMRWIADALRKDALGWLVRAGGWRRRAVVVGGRRREGRVWDPRIFPGLDVRFTAGPLHLLVALMEASGEREATLPRLSSVQRARVTAGVADDSPATGDLLALHRLVAPLAPSTAPAPLQCPRCGASPPGSDEAAEEPCPLCANLAAVHADSERWAPLLALSPLTLLFRPAEAGRLDAFADPTQGAQALSPLFRGDRPLLCSYLDATLARAWLREERARRRLGARRALSSYAATVRTLGAFVRAAEGRPDALRPLLAFFGGYLREFGRRAPVVDALREQARGFDRASERQAFLRQAGELFGLARAVTRAVEATLAETYVDRTEEQKVLLADHHERFSELAPEVEAIRRELTGEIG